MRTMNKVTLIGRVCDESAPDGSDVRLLVATTRSRKDGDKWVEDRDVHDVRVTTAAEKAFAMTLLSGSLVSVEGEIAYVTDRKTGNVTTRIQAQRLGLLQGDRS